MSRFKSGIFWLVIVTAAPLLAFENVRPIHGEAALPRTAEEISAENTKFEEKIRSEMGISVSRVWTYDQQWNAKFSPTLEEYNRSLRKFLLEAEATLGNRSYPMPIKLEVYGSSWFRPRISGEKSPAIGGRLNTNSIAFAPGSEEQVVEFLRNSFFLAGSQKAQQQNLRNRAVRELIREKWNALRPHVSIDSEFLSGTQEGDWKLALKDHAITVKYPALGDSHIDYFHQEQLLRGLLNLEARAASSAKLNEVYLSEKDAGFKNWLAFDDGRVTKDQINYVIEQKMQAIAKTPESNR